MPGFNRLVRNITILACACLWSANANPLTQQPPTISFSQTARGWLNSFWNLPVFHLFAPVFQRTPDPLPANPEEVAVVEPEVTEPAEPCGVAPLDPIEDEAAQNLESSVTTNIDVYDMMPAAARALDRFQTNVAAAGGTIIMKSAYRPAAYQKHLRNVWYKWMDELKANEDAGCQALRAEVQGEFARHHLIETQHPASASDHTRGLAFDALVDLPSHAKLGRRFVTVDTLARLAGLKRPVIVADPVHFKFVGTLAGSGSRSVRLRRKG